jgi:hypothetical protein
MTKANPNITTSFSRRDAVSRIIGGAAAGASGLGASAACASAGDDPSIRSLIETHEHLWAAYGEAIGAHNAAFDEYKAGKRASEQMARVCIGHTEPTTLIVGDRRHDFEPQPIMVSDHEAIDKWCDDQIGRHPENATAINERRKAFHAGLDQEVKRIQAKDDQFETTPFARACDAACNAEGRALAATRALFTAQAATFAGLLAQINYAATFIRAEEMRDDEDYDEDSARLPVPKLLDALASAIEKLRRDGHA